MESIEWEKPLSVITRLVMAEAAWDAIADYVDGLEPEDRSGLEDLTSLILTDPLLRHSPLRRVAIWADAALMYATGGLSRSAAQAWAALRVS